MGGVLPPWTPTLCAVAALSCALGAGRPARHSRLPLLLALPIGGAALQLVPLPAGLLGTLSPQAQHLRGAGPLTLDGPATAYELGRAAALFAFAVAVERLCGEHHRSRWLLRGIVAAGLFQVGVAGVHLLRRNTTSILGLYALPPGWESGLGTFVNRNHAACLLLLSCGVTAGLLLDRASARRRLLLGAALGLQLLALGLSLSRGALAAAAAAGALLGGAALRRQLSRGAALLLALGMSAFLLFLAVVLLPGLAQRLHPLLDGSLLRYQKVQVWRDALPLIGDFWLTGVGRGAFQSVFPPYRTGDEYVSVPYVASLPLQQAAELGLPLTIALWGMGGALLHELWRRRRALGWPEWGAAAGLLAVLLQNFVDFGLELPGVSVPVVAALALITARAHRREVQVRRPLLPVTAAGVAAAAGLLCLPASRQLLSVDKARIRQALRAGDVAEAERRYAAAVVRHPVDYNVALLGASAALLGRQPPQIVLRRTNRVLELHPADAQAHRIAARTLARMGRRAQAVLELRLGFARGLTVDAASLAEAAALVPPWDLPDALPQHPDVQRRLAQQLAQQGHAEAAQRAERRAALLAPHW